MIAVEANGVTECIVAMPETVEMKKEALVWLLTMTNSRIAFTVLKGKSLFTKEKKQKMERSFQSIKSQKIHAKTVLCLECVLKIKQEVDE